MAVQAPGPVVRWVDALAAGDAEASDAARTAGHVGRWPQSGELIRGREALRNIETAFPGGMPVLTSLRRIVGRDELWTVEGSVTYPDGGDWFLLAILELEGDRVAATTEYFGQALEAPAWRAAHVEQIDGRAAPPALPPAADLRGSALSEMTDGYAKAMAIRDFETLRRFRAPGWTTDWPQSGERIPSHEADVAIHGDYPGYPTLNFHETRAPGEGWELTAMFAPIRVHGAGPIVVIEGVNDYPDAGRWFIGGVIDVGDGRVRRETHYYTQPFEAAAWRAPFVERYDPLASRS
jgi:hypothetical protein